MMKNFQQGPEVYTDDHLHGSSFDWFCAGVTLHEFLTGKRPYEASRLQNYYSSDMRDPLELDSLMKMNLSPACVSFVTQILIPNVTVLFLLFDVSSSALKLEVSSSWSQRRIPRVFISLMDGKLY